MANDVTAVFGGDIGPMEKAMAQLRASMKATAASASKDLTFQPRVDDTALKAATANIAMHMKQMQSGAAFKPVLNTPEVLPVAQVAALRSGATAGAGAGLRSFQISNTANQLQDMAVQLQMGTRVSTIFAQQVPQLLSAFGPSAAILGGVAALGGLLVTVGDNARRAFEGMIQGASDSHKEITKLLNSGGVKELSDAMSQLRAQEMAFDAHRSTMAKGDLSGPGGLSDKFGGFVSGGFAKLGGMISGGAGLLTGGKTWTDQEKDMQDAEVTRLLDRVALNKKAKEESAEELKIALLRSKGYDDEAEKLERSLALKKQLAQVDASDLSPQSKEARKRDLTAISAAMERGKVEKEQREKDEALKRGIDEQRKGLVGDRMSGMSGVDRLKALEARQKELKKEAALGRLSLDEAGITQMQKAGNLEGAEKSLRLLREHEGLRREIEGLTTALKEQAEAEAAVQRAVVATNAARMQGLADAVVQTAKESAAAANLKQLQEAAALGDMKTSAAILHARAHGHTQKAERMESVAGEESKMKELMRNGMPEAEARKMAGSMQRDEDKLAGRSTRIRSNHQWEDTFGIDKMRTPGLDAMAAKQGKSLRSEFQFPGLDAMAKRQAGLNAERGARGAEAMTNTLLGAVRDAVEKGFSMMDSKLNFVN